MASANYDINLFQKSDYSQVFSLGYDITNILLKAALAVGDENIYFIITKLDAFYFMLTLPKEIINTLDLTSYKWDLKQVSDGLTSPPIIRGNVIVNPSVTE